MTVWKSPDEILLHKQWSQGADLILKKAYTAACQLCGQETQQGLHPVKCGSDLATCIDFTTRQGLTSRLTEPQPEMSSSLASFFTASESICDPTAPSPQRRSSAERRLRAQPTTQHAKAKGLQYQAPCLQGACDGTADTTALDL